MDQRQQQQEETKDAEVRLTANFTLCLGPLSAMYGGGLNGSMTLEAIRVAKAHDRRGSMLIERDFNRQRTARLYELDGEEFR